MVPCPCAHKSAQYVGCFLGCPTCPPSLLVLGLPPPSRPGCPWPSYSSSACKISSMQQLQWHPVLDLVLRGPRASLTWRPCLRWCCGGSTCVSPRWRTLSWLSSCLSPSCTSLCRSSLSAPTAVYRRPHTCALGEDVVVLAVADPRPCRTSHCHSSSVTAAPRTGLSGLPSWAFGFSTAQWMPYGLKAASSKETTTLDMC